ncbi:MAG: hypothetical protein ACE37N_06215 [Pseudohongiellaceae bacterium]
MKFPALRQLLAVFALSIPVTQLFAQDSDRFLYDIPRTSQTPAIDGEVNGPTTGLSDGIRAGDSIPAAVGPAC